VLDYGAVDHVFEGWGFGVHGSLGYEGVEDLALFDVVC